MVDKSNLALKFEKNYLVMLDIKYSLITFVFLFILISTLLWKAKSCWQYQVWSYVVIWNYSSYYCYYGCSAGYFIAVIVRRHHPIASQWEPACRGLLRIGVVLIWFGAVDANADVWNADLDDVDAEVEVNVVDVDDVIDMDISDNVPSSKMHLCMNASTCLTYNMRRFEVQTKTLPQPIKDKSKTTFALLQIYK